MGIIRGATKQIDDPFAPDHKITIRMLSHFELQEAREARFDQIVDKLKRLGELRSAVTTATREDGAKALAQDPLSEYDVRTLLRLGVAAWTHPGDVDVAQFDEETAPAVAREILRYSTREAA
jgi:hypothetical protein